MLVKTAFLIAVMVALVMSGCSTGTETQKTPDRAGMEKYGDLYEDGLQEPWQASSAPYAVPSDDTETVAAKAGRSPGAAAEEKKETGRIWKGRFFLREFMPSVAPSLVDAKQVYMGASPRIHRSDMVPPAEVGITRTRVAVRTDTGDPEWLILVDQEADYRMFVVIRWLEIDRALSWVGTEHILLGKLSFGGVTFESDEAFPLHFKLIQDVGYVHLCGRGTATTPEGRTYSLGQDQHFGDFLKGLTAPDQLTREAGAEALGWVAKTDKERDEAVPALVNALKDNAMEVRRNAAASLRRIGDSSAREGLRAALKEEHDEWVRYVIQDALKKLGGT